MPIHVNMPHLSSRKTKIIATLGPASDTPEVIYNLIKAGVNVFRLNMSHGEHESHRKLYQIIRESAEALHQHITILPIFAAPRSEPGDLKMAASFLKPATVL